MKYMNFREFEEHTGFSRTIIERLMREGMPFIQTMARGAIRFTQDSLDWINRKHMKNKEA